MKLVTSAVVLLLCASPARAAQGDCAQPVTAGARPTATDCLFILRSAVGSETCEPECVCDANATGDTTATDALVCLRSAVGQDVDLACRCGAIAVGDQVQLNSYSAGDQVAPAVAADGQGGFVVAWESAGSSGPDTDGSAILAQRFSSDGAAVGTEFQVNAFTTGDQRFASVAASTEGFVVAWTSAPGGGGDATADVRARRFDADAAPLGTEFRVNTYTPGAQGSPHVAVDPGSGRFVVAWQSAGSPGSDASGYSILGQRYDAQGAPAGSEFQVNTLTGDGQVAPAVTFLEGGGFVVVWETLAGSGTDPDANIRAQMFTEDGDPESTEFRVNSYTTGAQSRPSVASDGAGGFTIAWHGANSGDDTDGGVRVRRFGTGGVPAAEVVVNSYTTGPQADARIAPLDAARFVVVWHSAASAGDAGDAIAAQVFGNDAHPIGTELQVNAYTTATQSLPDVAAQPDGDFLVVWQTEGSGGADAAGFSIAGQRFE